MRTAVFFAALLPATAFQGGEGEKLRYLRPSGKGFVTECTFTIAEGDRGRTVASVTERGTSTLTVQARHDAAGSLLEAGAVLAAGGERKSVAVSVSGGTAKIRRQGQEEQELEVPQGVIVTSAPDWTDAFLLCRRRDRGKEGKQEFPGLWIHPQQAAQRLTFSVEKTGGVTLERGGEKIELDRLSIRLRGNGAYLAWADARGRMVKLVPAPWKEGGDELVLEGFEEFSARLRD